MTETVRSRAAEFRAKARQALTGHWGAAVGTTFVAGLLGYNGGNGVGSISNAYSQILEKQDNTYDTVSEVLGSPLFSAVIGIFLAFFAFAVIWGLIDFFLSGAITMGYNHFLLNMVRGQEAGFSDLFSQFKLFWKSLGLLIVMGVFTALWTLLLVIPGIVAAYRYSLAPFLMVDNPDMGIMEAIDESKRLMSGNKWKLFVLQLSFIGWGILCLFTAGIGFLFLCPYMYTSYACFYQEVKDLNTKSAQIPEQM